MFKDIYEKKGYESRLLSRTVEDSVTVTSVLIPWNTCGMTQATILGVATFIYLPYCFFNLISVDEHHDCCDRVQNKKEK